MNLPSKSEACERAIEVIAERGWHQGDFEDTDGSVCAMGALYAAMGVEARGERTRHLQNA